MLSLKHSFMQIFIRVMIWISFGRKCLLWKEIRVNYQHPIITIEYFQHLIEYLLFRSLIIPQQEKISGILTVAISCNIGIFSSKIMKYSHYSIIGSIQREKLQLVISLAWGLRRPPWGGIKTIGDDWSARI